MQRPGVRPYDNKVRLSRGVSPRQSDPDEDAFLDGVISPRERLPHPPEVVEPARNYSSIAVVVGRKSGSQRQAPSKPVEQKYPLDYLEPAGHRQAPQKQIPRKQIPQKPVLQKPLPQRPVSQKRQHKALPPRPAPRVPARPVVSRLPALQAQASATIARTAAGSITVLKRAYGAVFNPDDRLAIEAADEDGLKAYLVRSFENQRRAGGRVLAVALLVGGGWATLMPLSGAVVIPGTVVAESSVKKIQHQTGGVIAAIGVTDGMHVKEGDILIRLDDTQVRSNYQVVSNQLDEVRARIARLTAERDGREDPTPAAKMPAASTPARDRAGDSEQLLTSENTLFKARADSRKSQRELLRGRIAQLNDEIGGMDAQIKSKKTQADLIIQELDGVQQLWDKRLVPLNRLTGLQREAARIDGEKAQLVSSIAETRGKISEAELQLLKLDQDFRADVMKDLREAQDKQSELIERVVAAKDQLNHIDLRAPVSGVVHQLGVHTVGGVVSPAEIMMVIVPESDELQIDAHLPPDQIDQVRKGQEAQVRFPAFNQRTTPELSGVVSYVSADITRDPQQQSGPGYYTVRVSLPGQEFARLGDRQLIAGMPAELFIQTGSRTMMSYMFKPITEQLHRMFRER